MTMWDYIDQHPVYTFFLGFFVLFVLSGVLSFLFKCWNRMWRHLNVRSAGWPPTHLDADGDWPKKCDCEDDDS